MTQKKTQKIESPGTENGYFFWLGDIDDPKHVFGPITEADFEERILGSREMDRKWREVDLSEEQDVGG